MTFRLLKQVFAENNIPEDANLESDSGWECDPTDIDGIYYNRKTNTVMFTQYAPNPGTVHDYDKDPDWEIIYSCCSV